MILTFEKPKKIMDAKEREEKYSSDSGVPGTFVPNMTQADRERYKAKIVAGDVPRIEIRVSHDCEMLIKVKNTKFGRGKGWNSLEEKKGYEHGYDNIKMSMNGAANFTYDEWQIFKQAMDEAIELAIAKT